MAKMVNHFRLWVSIFIRRHERERKRERETKSRREFKISPTRVASQCAWQFLPYHRFISTLQDIILSRDKYFKLLVSSSSSFSSESMEIIRNAQAHVNSSAAFNPTKIRETETEREKEAHALQSGYTQTREVSLFSWSTCSKGNAEYTSFHLATLPPM